MTFTIDQHPTIIRFSGGQEDTLGMLFLNGIFQHFTLEDEHRNEKVHGETRIPAGTYPLGLRTEGGFHQKYRDKFPQLHEGMVQIENVPDFKYILYHIGNNDEDTAGCILPGDSAQSNKIRNGFVGHSTKAYERTYPKLVEYIQTADQPVIEIIDLDRIAA
jgi:hypothetical protein